MVVWDFFHQQYVNLSMFSCSLFAFVSKVWMMLYTSQTNTSTLPHQLTVSHCWWLKFRSTWDVANPINNSKTLPINWCFQDFWTTNSYGNLKETMPPRPKNKSWIRGIMVVNNPQYGWETGSFSRRLKPSQNDDVRRLWQLPKAPFWIFQSAS